LQSIGANFVDVGGTKDGFSALFDALSLNKANNISTFDLANNAMEDKGLQVFANFLQVTPISIFFSNEYGLLTPIGVASIDIENISAGKTGLAALFNSLKDRAKIKGNSILSYLNISENKLSQVGSDALVGMLAQIGIHIKTLILANTSPVLEVIFEALKKGCPHLETLDVSKNKLKPSECTSLAKYLESQSSLINLNLSQTKFPPESIKELLLSVTGCSVDLRVNLSDNGFGPQVGTLIASIAFKMANIHTLDLSDNELAEEGISALCEGLCSNTCLRRLILDNNWKSAGKARTDAVENLIKLISANPFLEGLSISYYILTKLALSIASNAKSSPLRHEIVPFLYTLGNNASLMSLNISGHQMGNKGAIALSKALQTNHILTSLTWDDNNTTLLGFISIFLNLY
jgi:Ran GTPase-activating protein (RanGAP) involved in mRNA processing and transport